MALHLFHPARSRPVAFSDRHQRARDAEQLNDRQVLAGLRHHPVIRRDYQQHQIDALRTSEHVVGEFFVAGHVDESGQPGARCEFGVEITEVDGHAAFALLRAAVAGLPRQRLQQRSLAVVDVPRRADDHRSTCNCANCASHAGSSSS